MGVAGPENACPYSEAILVIHLSWLRASTLLSLQPAIPVGHSDWNEIVLRGAEPLSCVPLMRSKFRRADRSASCHRLQRLPC